MASRTGVAQRVQKHRLAFRAAGLRLVQIWAQVMIDKTQTVPRDKIGSTIGRLHSVVLVEAERALATFLGIG